MAIDPLKFLEIAERYKNSGHEHERRTSIGRSYYGVYNFLWTELRKAGVHRFRGDGKDHTRMVHFLSKCQNYHAGLVAGFLKTLKSARRTADYEMEQTVAESKSEFIHGRAIRAVETFQKVPNWASVAAVINQLPEPPSFTY
jgi:hypothetical protein